MQFFKNNYGFRVPYQLLIDGTFCLAALKEQVQLAEQLPKYFDCELKMLTTQCVFLEVEKLGNFLYFPHDVCSLRCKGNHSIMVPPC